MAQRKAWTRWLRLWGPKRPALRSADDFADYGTAFGLDMSLAAAGRDLPSPLHKASQLPTDLDTPRLGAPS